MFFLECKGTVSRIGNGYCDDENNNMECDYDGDDCCGELVNTEHCTFCECHLNHGMYTKKQNKISLFHFLKQKGILWPTENIHKNSVTPFNFCAVITIKLDHKYKQD